MVELRTFVSKFSLDIGAKCLRWAVGCGVLLVVTVASGADINWDGDGVQGNFTWNENWFGNSQPTWNSGNNLHFSYRNNGSQTSLYYDYGAWRSINDIIYDVTFGAGLTLSSDGNGIDFYGKVENAGTFTQTINMPLSGKNSTKIELNPVQGNLVLQNNLYNDNSKPFEIWGDNGKTITVSGTLGGSGSGATFTIKQNSIAEFTTSAQQFAGDVFIDRGELWLGSGATLKSGSITVGNSGTQTGTAKLWISNSSGGVTVTQNLVVASSAGAQYRVIGGLNSSGYGTFSGNVTLQGNVTLEANQAGGTVTLSGVISQSGGTYGVTKAGPGAVVLAGSSSNTYAGATTVNAGTLNLGKSAEVNAVGGNLVISGGTVQYSSTSNEQLADTGSLTLSSGAFIMGARTETINALSMSGGSLTIASGKLTLTSASTISGGAVEVTASTGTITINANLTLNGGTINLSGDGTLNLRGGTGTGIIYQDSSSTAAFITNGAVSINTAGGAQTVFDIGDAGAVATELTVKSALTGGASGGLLKQGAGVLLLGGAAANTFTGPITVNAGVLQLAKSAGTAAIPGNLVVGDGTGGANADVVRLFAANQVSDAAAVTVNSSGLFDLNGNDETIGSLAGSGNVTLGAALLSVGDGNNTTFSGSISGAGSFTKQGAGTLTLSGANTYNGDTTISVGQLKLGSADVLPDGGGKGNVIVTGTLNLAGFSDTINGLSGLGTVDNTTGNGALTVGGNNQSSTFDGTIQNTSGTLAITKTGTGTLTLTGANTHSGRTTVSNGTLVVANATGSGTGVGGLLVVSGATLSMQNGIISGTTLTNLGTVINFGTITSTMVNSGAVFAVTNGANAGTLTINLAGTINAAGATLGTIGTNAVLNLLTPGATPFLVNNGTISMSGGTILLNGVAGTITNNNIIAGVGNVSTLPIVTAGAGSFIAQAPLPGLNALLASVGVTNTGLLGANNALGGAATLTLGTSTGGGLVNDGTVALLGGFMTLTNASGGNATLTNNTGLIYGFGTNNLVVGNLVGGTILASNGVFGLLLENNTNTGTLTNFNAGSTLFFNTNVLANAGKIFLSGGTLTLAGSVVTNQGTITGPGTETSSLYNDTTGIVIATNGTLSVATGAGESNQNFGTYLLAGGNAGTLSVGPAWDNNGVISNFGGYLAGGNVTNLNLMVGAGTNVATVVNAGGGNIVATNGVFGFTGGLSNAATVRVANGATLNVVPTWRNTGVITNLGGTVAGGALSNSGTIVISTAGTLASSALNNSGGTLAVSNGATLHLVSATFTNTGRILMTAAGGQTTDFNYGLAGHRFVNAASGSISNSGDGTATFTGTGNFPFHNAGAISVNSGTLVVNSQDAFLLSGFLNDGTVTVNSGGNFVITRSANAWGFGGNANNPTNNGTIYLNGGTITALVDGNAGQAATNFLLNNATILGSGTLAMSVKQTASGFLIASNGTLNIFGTYNSGQATFTAGGTGNYGSFVAATSGTLKVVGNVAVGSGFSGSWQANNGGTIEIAANVDLGNAFMPASQLNGTIKVNSGANLTLSANTGIGGATLGQGGTFAFAGGTIYMPNVAGLAVFTNAGYFSGSGTFQTGYGSGNENYGIVNAGTILADGGGTLVLNSANAFTIGFSNTATGFLILSNNTTLAIRRDTTAWNSGTVAANAGTVILGGGTLTVQAGATADSTRMLRNLGTITTWANSTNTLRLSIQNLGTIALTGTASQVTLTGPGTATINAPAGVIDVRNLSQLLITNIAGAGSTLSFTNAGVIRLRDGIVVGSGDITNTGTIVGDGTVSGPGVVNAGMILASNLTANLATLTVAVNSFTNPANGTLGVLGTNTTLDVTIPGGGSQPLINLGTITMAGGTLLVSGNPSGTISNRPTGTIIGVGNVTQTVFNDGTVMAANPISGLSVFSVGLSELNTATIGASNGATLNVVISGGAQSTFVNNGSIAMLGGTLIISNGTPGTITNNFMISGVGTSAPAIYNAGTIAATVNGGVLDVTLLGGTNTAAGRLLAGLGATLQVENHLLNLGTIAPNGTNGGAIQIAQETGVITNRGTILGIDGLTFNSFLRNEGSGTIYATNGVVNFNAVNGLFNTGMVLITNGGTFQSNSSNSWTSAGTIDLRGGTLRTGGYTNAVSRIFTNTGLITGYGSIIGGGAYGGTGGGYDKSFLNQGTLIVTNPVDGTARTLFITTGDALTADGIENVGTMVVSSNNTLSLNRSAGLPILNHGTITIQNGTLAASGTISNDTDGIIEGYGTLTAVMVNRSGGTIRATNGLLIMTSSVNPINQGTLQISAGATMTWNTSNAWQNSGTVDIRGGTLRTGGATLVFAGEPFTNLNYIVGYGSIIGGGAFGSAGPSNDKAIFNFGTIIAHGGALVIDTGVATMSNGIANFGTMIISNATDTLELRRAAESLIGNLNYIENSGRILINGGTLTANSALTNRAYGLAQPGLIQGHGHIAITNQLANLGTIRSTNGVLHFVTPSGGAALDIRQSGTLVVESGSEMIFGVSSNAPLANNGTIVMRGGILQSGTMTNSLGGRFAGFGTITSPTLINSGTGMATSLAQVLRLTGDTLLNRSTGVIGADTGRLIVNAIFTNAGTVSFRNSYGTFNASVVNENAWLTDPTTLTFNGDYTVATNGYINMASSDVYSFKSNFFNFSSLSNQYNTAGEFIFDGAGGHTQVFSVAGINLGGWNSSLQPSNEVFFTENGATVSTNSFTFKGYDDFAGFSNNFSLGELTLGSGVVTSTLTLVDTHGFFLPDDGLVAGLYVNKLTISPGSLLIVSNNVQLFYKQGTGINGISVGIWDGSSSVLLLNGSSFHQINVVPEPSVLLLLMVGAAGIYYRRRRSGKA
ncbi:MAG: hypothetical protein PCFJNLEI_01428 [Verrucomicrobiae bacterium]|nr:hypothetical protein [Verrucomicrobiae bacterium]